MANELQFRDLINVLRQRWRMIVVVALGGTTLVLLGAMLVAAHYTATAEIVLLQQQTGVVAPQASEQTILTKVTELSSEALLRRTIDSLSRDPAFQAADSQASTQSRTSGDLVRGALRRRLPDWLSPWHALRACRLLRVAELRRHLKVAQEAGSHVIAVHYTSTSPDVAALIANRVAALYLRGQTEQQQATARRSLTWLDQRVPEVKSELMAVETTIQDYRRAHGLADVNPTAVADQQFAELTRQIGVAEAGLAADRSRLEGVRGDHGTAVADTLDTPALDALRAREAALLQREAGLAVSLGHNHPEMQQVRSAIGEVRQKIRQELGRAESGLRERARAQATQVRLLRHELATVQDASSDLRLGELDRRATATRQLYDSLLGRREATLERLETASSGFEVVSHAVPPEHPSSPNPVLFAPPALVLFLACGAFLAITMDRLDGTIRSEGQVGEALGIPCAGFVPRLRRTSRGRPHQRLLRDTYGPYVEAIRSVVATSMLMAKREPQVVLVTSSVPGEGKTTLAVSYATCAARLGRRTILLDLDFRHPATSREVGGTGQERTLERLLQDRPVCEIVQRIPLLQLDYVPMGRGTGDPLRLFAGNQIGTLLQRLRDHYDCIVIDSAPLLAVAETRVLATMADQVLFVVKWGRTSRQVAANALGLLRRVGMRFDRETCLVAAVVTQLDLRKHARSRGGDVAEALVRYGQYYGQEDRLDA